jgi:hypothetical protein
MGRFLHAVRWLRELSRPSLLLPGIGGEPLAALMVVCVTAGFAIYFRKITDAD